MLGGFALSKRSNDLTVQTDLSGIFNGEVDENQLEFRRFFLVKQCFEGV